MGRGRTYVKGLGGGLAVGHGLGSGRHVEFCRGEKLLFEVVLEKMEMLTCVWVWDLWDVRDVDGRGRVRAKMWKNCGLVE